MTVVYVAGRVGQMRLNHSHKTTEGMSLDMFVMAVAANLLAYAGSILVRWGAALAATHACCESVSGRMTQALSCMLHGDRLHGTALG
jgi:hypothetical protein